MAHRAWSPHFVVSWRKHWKVNLRFFITSLGPSHASPERPGPGSKPVAPGQAALPPSSGCPSLLQGTAQPGRPSSRPAAPALPRRWRVSATASSPPRPRVSAFAPASTAVNSKRSRSSRCLCSGLAAAGARSWALGWCLVLGQAAGVLTRVTCFHATGRHSLKCPTLGFYPNSC